MVSGPDLVDWLNDDDPLDVTPTGLVTGRSKHLGPYTARTHPEYRFVTSLQVGTHPYLRTLLEMTAYHLIDRDDLFLRDDDLNPRLLECQLRRSPPSGRDPTASRSPRGRLE